MYGATWYGAHPIDPHKGSQEEEKGPEAGPGEATADDDRRGDRRTGDGGGRASEVALRLTAFDHAEVTIARELFVIVGDCSVALAS